VIPSYHPTQHLPRGFINTKNLALLLRRWEVSVHNDQVRILPFPYKTCGGTCGSGKGLPPRTTVDIIPQLLHTLLCKERRTKPENLQNHAKLKYKITGYQSIVTFF